MKRIVTTLVMSALVGALAMPAFAGSPTLSLAQKPQDPRAVAVQPAPEVRQPLAAPETGSWSGEHRRHDWDQPYGKPIVRYGWSDKPLPEYRAYPKWEYRSPVYVPQQWVWDGHIWVLTPGYWAY